MDPIPLKRRSDLHVARKLWHVLGVLTMAGAHSLMTDDQALRLLALFSFFGVTLDIVRHQWPSVNKLVLRFMGLFMRDHERDNLAGTTYLMIGALLILWWFPRPIVTLTFLFLAMADPLASYVGIRFGKDKLVGPKSLQGTMAAFAVCTVIAAIYFSYTGLMSERLLLVTLLAGLGGALSELIPIGKLDDNLTFPLINACVLWVIFSLFGGLV